MAASVARSAKSVFVTKIHWTVSKHDLLKHFERVGRVSHGHIVLDKKTGLHKGFGFVTFFNENDAIKACKQVHFIHGQKTIVQLKSDTSRPYKPANKGLDTIMK